MTSISSSERASRMKLAKLIAAFNQDAEKIFIETILRTEGNINYAIPFGEHWELDHTLQAGTILHQVGKLNKNKIPNIIELLLQYGVDVTVKNSEGQTALHSEIIRQCQNNHNSSNIFEHPIIECILSAHIDGSIRQNPRDDNGITHFHVACMSKHVRALDFFLDHAEVDVNHIINENSPVFPGCTPLHIAVKLRSLDIAKKLLEHGANIHCIDTEGLTPMYAVVKRNIEIVNWGSRMNQDVVQEYQTNQKMIHLLLTTDSGNNNNINNAIQNIIDDHGFSTFHAACTVDDISLVENLLNHVADINHFIATDAPFWPGHTALHFAAYFNFDLLKLLFEKGGNIMAKDADGVTPFDICLQRSSIRDIHSILSRHTAYKNIVFSDKKTKLFDLFLAMQNVSGYQSFLNGIEDVSMSVDQNSSFWPGYTLLHFAVLFSGRFEADFYKLLHSNNNDECQDAYWLFNECIKRGMEVTVTMKDLYGLTPVHLAFYLQKDVIIDVLLECLENHHKIIDSVDRNNLSLLYIACSGSNDSFVYESLLQNGADVNCCIQLTVKCAKRNPITNHLLTTFPIKAGCTPLHVAAFDNDLEVAKFLLKYGADPNALDEDGWSPIHKVMLSHNTDSLGRALLSSVKSRERIVEDIGLSHLHVACCMDSLRGVKKMLKLGSDVNAAITCDSSIARSKKYIDHNCRGECDLLCKNNYTGFTPLHFAVQQGSVKTVKILLEASADVLARDAKGRSPFYEVLSTTTTRSNKLLSLFVRHLQSNGEIQKRLREDSGMTLLHIFSFIMDVNAIEKLLESGSVNVNAQMKSDSPIWPGCTALHTWVYGSLERDSAAEDVQNTLKLLLDSGVDVTLANAVLDTPLHSYNYSQITVDVTLSTGRLMLRSQRNLAMNPVNATGVSHFHISVWMCDVVIAEEFLKHGADVDQPVDYFFNDNYQVERPGCSPLHLLLYAQSRYLQALPARIETIDLLLRYGADVRARDVFGNTSLHAIASNEYLRENLLEKIIAAGGNVDDVNMYGETPFAVLMSSNTKITPKEINVFLQRGCGVNVYGAIDKTGFLSLALNRNYRIRTMKQFNDIYKTLIKNPDVKSIDKIGRTAIHNVVSTTAKVGGFYVELIERLIKLGCDIDAQDHSGKTALHVAAQLKNDRTVGALLMCGADLNIVDKNGKSPSDYCLDKCQCSKKRNAHYHKDVIKITFMHVKKMQVLNLQVSQHNANFINKALKKCKMNLSMSLLGEGQLEEMKNVNVLESGSIKLYDFLSERGAVTTYATLPRLKRKSVDKFFKTKNKVLNEFDEFVGLLKLQYRKAVKREALFELAKSSLQILNRLSLPLLCSENLLKYLSLYDVENLIVAARIQVTARSKS